MTLKTPMIDPENGIRLCGASRALYASMLHRFTQDKTVSRLSAALLVGDSHEAFLQAHSLKGLSAQLSLSALHDFADALCGLLRRENAIDPTEARRQLCALEEIHAKTLDAIRQFILAPPRDL